MTDVSLVLPTYNERDNLAALCARVTDALRGFSHEIIIVDDDSPDGTWEEAECLRASYPALRVVRRVGERGLASAVIRGFREARGQVLAVMDADLQHDEALLPVLVEGARGADFVVASRTVEGGAFGRWAWHRRLKSWVATMLARLVVDVSLSDPMSGFFALRRDVFTALDDGSLRPEGFKIFLYLYLRACHRMGPEHVTVREVGYVFRQRVHGESKLTGRVMWEYLRMLFASRRSFLPTGFITFALVGALGVVVNSVVLLGLVQWAALPYLLAGAIAIEAAIVHNFILNDQWTFRARRGRRRRPLLSRFGRFQLVSLGGMAINMAALWLLHGGLRWPLVSSNLIGIAGAVAYNYVTNKLWTWRVVGPAASRREASPQAPKA
jgi:dolichol-phosphate mannosyltransferase